MKRRLRRWLVALLLLFVLVYIAPWIVAATSLRNTVLANVFSDVRGSVRCGSASFGWFSPIVLSDVSVLDEQGANVLTASHIESEKSLLALATDSIDLGRFTLREPQVDITIESDTTNVEQVFHDWIHSESDSAMGIEVVVSDATVRLPGGEIQLANLEFAKPLATTDKMELAASLHTGRAGQQGTLDVVLAIEQLAGDGSVVVTSNGWPISVLRPLVQRLAPGSEVSGVATGDATVVWRGGSVQVDSDVAVHALRVAGAWLGSEQIHAEQLSSVAKLTLGDDQIDIETCELKSELGSATISGKVPLAWSGWQHLADEDLTIQGHVDLVRLANLLPDTLRIREGTQITQGTIRVFATSFDQPKGRTWKANLVATDLVARNGQKTLTWPEPISVNLSAYRGQTGPVIERASCRSKFLTVEGSGTLERLTLDAHADLAQLIADAGRFVDTAGIKLAGVVDAKLHSSVVNGRLDVRGSAELKKLEVVWDDTLLWREDTARAELKLAGDWKNNAFATVDSARLDLFGNQEQAVVRLEKPVLDLAKPGAVALRAGYGGRFGAWPERIATWLGETPTLPFSENDAVSFDSLVNLDSGRAVWSMAKFTVTPLALAGGRPVPTAVKPGLEVTSAGDWDFATETLRLRDLVAKSAGWTLRAPRFSYVIASSAPLAIDATVQGDLSKIRSWSPGGSANSGSTLSGTLDGKVELSQGESENVCVVDAHIDNFVATSATGRRWQEKRLEVDGQAAWDATSGRWNIKRASIAGKDLSADARGFVSLGAERALDVSGELRYDLAKLSILLQSYLGQSFEMKGRDALTFAVRGKLPDASQAGSTRAWSGMTGHAKFGWDEAKYQGFHAGSVKIDAKLADGRVNLGRIETSLNDGKLAVEPVVHLTASGPVLTVAKGRVIDRVKITPEMCHSAIKYILPALADVTQAEGALSVELDHCTVPLAVPERAEVVGRLVAHKAVVSPNQVIGALAVLQQIPTLVRIEPEDVVPFQVARGRVYHKDLTMIFGRDVEVNNTGSVGFDNTLDLVVQAPVPSGILGDRPLGESLARQRIDIRITGTLDKPKVDREAVRRTIAKFASGTVNDFLNKELGNALDRLLKPRQR